MDQRLSAIYGGKNADRGNCIGYIICVYDHSDTHNSCNIKPKMRMFETNTKHLVQFNIQKHSWMVLSN